MASLLLLFLCMIVTSQGAPSKDTTVLNLIVETTSSAANRITSSVSRYPPVADYDNLNYFRSQISVLSDGTILAGAINRLYHIGQDFSAIATLNWAATNTALCDFTYDSSPFLCSNHIRIHELQQDGSTLLVCGTNAIKPRCRLHNLTNLALIPNTEITPQPGLVPYLPDFKGLTINNDAFPGGVLAVNYLGSIQVNFGISYQLVNVTGDVISNTIQYRSIQGNVNWIKTPAAYVDYYADSYSIDDSLSFYFIFLTENSVEISGTDNEVIYSRVVRLCKNDPGVGVLRGSSQEFKADFFKTFVKAYIYCEKPMPSGTNSVPGSASYQYNVIQKVSLVRNSTYRVGVSRRDRVVYGLFTGPTYGPPGSAICVFSADMSNNNDRGIFSVFNEEFRNLQPGQMSCTTQNVPNDDPFTCDPSTHNKSRPMPEFDILMSPAVSQLTTDPLVELDGITATSIYTTQTLACNSTMSPCTSANDLTEVDVMLVGTDGGKILKIVMTYNGTNHVPLISEELSLADNLPIQSMEPQFVNDQFDHLLLSTDSYIYRIPPQRCDRFETCVDCVKACDPYCFWNQNSDSSQRGCKILQNRAMYDPLMWYQDIHHGNVSQWNDCTGAVTNSTNSSEVVTDFTVRGDVSNSGVNIIITPENNSTFSVILYFEELHSCGTGVNSSLPGPEMFSVTGLTTRMYAMGFQPYTWYRVNITASVSGITRTVTLRSYGATPDTPSISQIFSTNDGMLVYPNIGCLRDDITNYTITVEYQYIPCPGTPQNGSMSLPGTQGSLFTITGLGSYTNVTSISVIAHNSFGSSMTTETSSLRTIEQTNTTSIVNSFLAIRSSFSLNISWDSLQSSSVCGTFTGYSVYVDSMQMRDCNRQTSHLITGLHPFTQYSISVTVCTVAGEGPMATVPSGMTRTLPGSPTRVQSINITTTTSTVTLNWNAVEFNDVGGTYEVDYTCYGRGNPVSNTVSNITATNYTISGINCYAADCYGRVRANNTAEESGLYSSEFRSVTSCPTMLPSSASVTANDITVETMTRNSICVNWTVPSDYCGPKRTFVATVTLQGSNTPLCANSTSQNFMNCDSLEVSKSYDIRVVTRITCSSGSVSSDSSLSTRSYTHPCFITDPPDNVAFTRSGSVVLRWDAVTNCGNVMYNVHWSCGGSRQMASTSQTSYALNVSNINSFSYCVGQVQACNDQGCGGLSDSVSVLVPLQPPPAVSITGTVNGTTVLIMFNIPEPTDLDDLHYTLYRRRTSPNPTVMFVPIFNNVSYNYTNVLTDNDPGDQETYEYQMELHNGVGTGPLSNTVSVTTTQEQSPGSPLPISVIQMGKELEIEWTAPPSLMYEVNYTCYGLENPISDTISNINTTNYTISGINCYEADCYGTVKTLNMSSNTSLYSSKFKGVTSCPTMLPSSASVTANDITVETMTRNSICVNWTAPSDYCGPKRTFVATVTLQGSNTPLCTNSTSQNFMNCDGLEFSRSYDIRVATRITCSSGSVSSDSSLSTRSYTHPCFITDPPDNVAFTRSGSVVLKWDVVTNCGNVMYNVHWSCRGSGQMSTTSQTSYTLNVNNLSSFSYCVGQVRACNGQGCGGLSDSVSVLIPLQPPPAVSITGSFNGTTVLIMFSIAEPTNLEDLSYTLFRRRTSPNPTIIFLPIFNNVSYNYTNVLTDNDPGEQETYEYQMELHNSVGTGPRSNIISMTATQEMSPGFTLDITVMQIGEDLMIEWTAPSGSSLTYEVDYTCYGLGNLVSNTIFNINTTNYTISGINCYEADCYGSVKTLNMTGNTSQYISKFRGITSCPTMLPSSESVTTNDITVETMKRNSIFVNWTVPSNYCGPERTFVATVTLQRSNTPLCTTTTSQNFMNCDGLEFSRSYDIRVVTRIICSSGGSVSSDSSVSSRSYTHPCFITDPPDNVAFTRSGSVVLKWDAVTNCGNVMYNVHWSCRGSGQMASTSQTSYTLNVNNSTSFSYCVGQVQACNDQGCGGLSDSVSVLIPLQPPPAVSFTGFFNGTTVLIMFSIAEPTNLDDLRYTLYHRRSSPNPTIMFVPIFNNVPYNYTNILTDNDPREQETYEYQMQLHNSVGTGPLSNTISVTITQELSPSSHLDINVTQFDQYLIIEWTSPPSLSLTYEVDYTCYYGYNNYESEIVSNILTTSYIISGVNCYEADCYGRVKTLNMSSNTSLYSSKFRGTTSCPKMLPSSASVTANDITVETMTRNSICVNWTVPSDYCGPKRTFVVTVTLQGSNTPLCTNSTSQNFMNCDGLEFSRSYDIRVATRIACSSGSVSSDSSVSPKSYAHPCFITDPPDNVAFTRSGSVVLRWDAIANCGNVMYNVYWSCRGSRQMASTSQTSYTLNVNNSNSFSYCVGQVQACNDQGCGGLSDSATVLIPLQPPPAVSITGADNGTNVLIMFNIAEPTDFDDLHYTLYRRNSTMMFMPIYSDVQYNFTNVLTDNKPVEQETYEYQMELHNSVGTSPLSNTISVRGVEELPPGSPLDISVVQMSEELTVEWTSPISSSSLTYTVQYDTVPPSPDGSLYTRDEIDLLSTTIPVSHLVFDHACSIRVRARDERTGFYGAWSYARTCYARTKTPPESPSINDTGLSYVYPLFKLQWDPPINHIGFISNYIVELLYVPTEKDSICNSDINGLCNQGTYNYTFPVKPDSTIYHKVINVTTSTCFCAAVTATNGAGNSSRANVSKFYKYETMSLKPATADKNKADDDNNSNAAKAASISLGVILAVVALIAIVLLAILFYFFYNSRMKQGALTSESITNLNSD